MELWDAYDKEFNKIPGVILVRGETIPEGVYHLVCEIIVKNVDGEYLIMQRDFNKHFGGLWELTSGGSALKGETPLECAKRELKEETGIIVTDLKEIARIIHDGHRSLYVVYFCITNWDKNKIVLQKGETIDYKWIDQKMLFEMEDDLIASKRTLNLLKEYKL